MVKNLIISASVILFTASVSFGQMGSVRPSVNPFIQSVSPEKQTLVVSKLQDEVISYSELYQKNKNESRFLKKLFFRIQRDHLARYDNNTELTDLFIGTKQYDCVTGTALYALILNALNINYSIKETDFHVYLIVHLPGKDILFEPTDPIYGYIDHPTVINERVLAYRNAEFSGGEINEGPRNESTNSSNITFHRDRVISLTQLAGLQYYNLATDAFNTGAHSDALEYMEIAISMYPNDRFNGFKEILLIDMAQSMSSN